MERKHYFELYTDLAPNKALFEVVPWAVARLLDGCAGPGFE